jgi:hypothetical protein
MDLLGESRLRRKHLDLTLATSELILHQTYHVVGKSRIVRVRRPIDGRKQSYDVRKRTVRCRQREIDQVIRNGSFNGWLCRT